MILFLDAHVPRAIAEGLRRRGVEIVTAQELGFDTTPDLELLEYCKERGWVLLTQDRGFLATHQRGVSHAGIIYARQRRGRFGEIIERAAFLATFDRSHLAGTLEYI